MTTKYAYTLEGTAADGQTWCSSGEVYTENEGDFPLALQDAQRRAFQQLTQGKAVYGIPGIGCRGPYKITKLIVERI
jgi:hypothetical protein